MTYEEFEVGQTYVTDFVTVTREEILDFAEKYDPHYFHQSDEGAKKSIFGELVAPGMLSVSLVYAQWVRMGVLGDDIQGGMEFDVRWSTPVYPNDKIYAEVTVIGKQLRPDSPYGLVTFESRCKKENGEEFAIANVTVIVRRCTDAQDEHRNPDV